MDKARMKLLLDRYEKKATVAEQNYQETGISRYGSAWRAAEEIADIIRVALAAADDHYDLVAYRCALQDIYAKARATEGTQDAGRMKALEDLAALCVSYGKLRAL